MNLIPVRKVLRRVLEIKVCKYSLLRPPLGIYMAYVNVLPFSLIFKLATV